MANMCDNHLSFICKDIPTWFVKDPNHGGISISIEPRYLFLNDTFEDISCEVNHDEEDNQVFIIDFTFQTKYQPPEDLYRSMIADPNIKSFDAFFYEEGWNVLGYANKEGIFQDTAPKIKFSDVLGLDIIKEQPPASYIALEGSENWTTFEEYKKEMKLSLPTCSAEDWTIITNEMKEMSEYFTSN